MGKLAILIVILFLGALALFSISNNDKTTINVPFDKAYEIPKMGLILVSSVIGALAMLVIFAIRDTRRYIVTYQYQRQKKKEEKIHGLYSRALNAILADDEIVAKTHLEEILKEEYEHTDSLLRLGDIALKQEDNDKALEYYKRAISSSPKSLEAMFSLVDVLETMQRWNDAMNHVEEILDLDPDNLSALYKKRALFERESKWDDVIDVQKAIIKHEHDEREKQREQAKLLGYRYELARDGLEQGEHEKAGKGFRSILRENKNFVPAYLGIAEAMMGQGETEAAASYIEKAYEQTRSQIVLARLEDLMINIGEPSRLIRTFRKAISDRPYDNNLKFFLGKLYYRLEMIDDAFETLSTVDVVESFPDLYNLMGELYLRRSQCEKAVAEFRKTLEIKKSLMVPYCCEVCRHMATEWSGRCPGCGEWNTYQLNLHGACKA